MVTHRKAPSAAAPACGCPSTSAVGCCHPSSGAATRVYDALCKAATVRRKVHRGTGATQPWAANEATTYSVVGKGWKYGMGERSGVGRDISRRKGQAYQLAT